MSSPSRQRSKSFCMESEKTSCKTIFPHGRPGSEGFFAEKDQLIFHPGLLETLTTCFPYFLSGFAYFPRFLLGGGSAPCASTLESAFTAGPLPLQFAWMRPALHVR